MGKKYHFIAIGGSVMHALAIALKQAGNQVTGSDDAIYGASRKALEAEGLVPEKDGWDVERINKNLDAIILGMHAKKDNPELAKAQELGIPIFSFPDFIYEFSKNKQRVVVAGSHGKSTITSMIMHVLKECGREFDYLVGAEVKGFKNRVKLSDAPLIIIEGDEYSTSATDPMPKFLKYQHHVGIISGIDWDHANVFPTEKQYIAQFEAFAEATPKAGTLSWNTDDKEVDRIGSVKYEDVYPGPFSLPKYKIKDGITYINDGKTPLKVFGEHNLLNIAAALSIMDKISISEEEFYQAISSYEGAGLRLEKIDSAEGEYHIYRDFAHSPSKVRATTLAVKQQFPKKPLVAVLELHTFSSLKKSFVSRYKKSLDPADEAIVFFQLGHKSLDAAEMIDTEGVKEAFTHPNLRVISEVEELEAAVKGIDTANNNVLLMSSGVFGGIDLNKIFKK